MMSKLTDYLQKWARISPDRTLYTFLDRDCNPAGSYTYASFHLRTNGLARILADEIGIKPTEPVLIVYPPGLEMIAAFIACVKAGAIPVPVPAPPAAALAAASQRLAIICNSAGVTRALTEHSLLATLSSMRETSKVNAASPSRARLLAIDWFATDGLGDPSDYFENRSQPLLFLQYTSGSTQEPRGVMVSHDNVIANSCGLGTDFPIAVSWLPHFHDMGLIGYYLRPMVRGGSAFHFSAADFLRHPLLWLEAIRRFRATDTSAPNFAYAYCLRRDKIPDDALPHLDLSSMRTMLNASEPACPTTMHRFLARFAAAGLAPDAVSVAYGLAENTLCVSMGGRVHVRLNRRFLQRNELRLVENHRKEHTSVLIASCGKPVSGVEVRIVAPETGKPVATNEIGEIWLAGTSKALGYWRRPDLTAEIFQARLASKDARFLRTGDLGFIYDDELYVCGRIKDMSVVRGINVHPTDIEALVERLLLPVPVRVAVFGFGQTEKNDDGIVVLVECRSGKHRVELATLCRKLRVHLDVPILTLACVPRRSIPSTSSGKMSRHRCRLLWRAGAIQVSDRIDPVAQGLEQSDVLSYVDWLVEQSGGDLKLSLGELGLDSFELVKLSLEIERFVIEHLGPGWLTDTMLDVRTLQSMTLGALKRLAQDILARRVLT
jgi:acyl-CoA synthetase (AMP-forming)/AMP-acid ligase II